MKTIVSKLETHVDPTWGLGHTPYGVVVFHGIDDQSLDWRAAGQALPTGSVPVCAATAGHAVFLTGVIDAPALALAEQALACLITGGAGRMAEGGDIP